MNKKQTRVRALVDSGSNGCAFPRFLAEHVGYDLTVSKTGSNVNMGIGGIEIKSWEHPFIIALLAPNAARRWIAWTCFVWMAKCIVPSTTPALRHVANAVKLWSVEE